MISLREEAIVSSTPWVSTPLLVEPTGSCVWASTYLWNLWLKILSLSLTLPLSSYTHTLSLLHFLLTHLKLEISWPLCVFLRRSHWLLSILPVYSTFGWASWKLCLGQHQSTALNIGLWNLWLKISCLSPPSLTQPILPPLSPSLLADTPKILGFMTSLCLCEERLSASIHLGCVLHFWSSQLASGSTLQSSAVLTTWHLNLLLKMPSPTPSLTSPFLPLSLSLSLHHIMLTQQKRQVLPTLYDKRSLAHILTVSSKFGQANMDSRMDLFYKTFLPQSQKCTRTFPNWLKNLWHKIPLSPIFSCHSPLPHLSSNIACW